MRSPYHLRNKKRPRSPSTTTMPHPSSPLKRKSLFSQDALMWAEEDYPVQSSPLGPKSTRSAAVMRAPQRTTANNSGNLFGHGLPANPIEDDSDEDARVFRTTSSVPANSNKRRSPSRTKKSRQAPNASRRVSTARPSTHTPSSNALQTPIKRTSPIELGSAQPARPVLSNKKQPTSPDSPFSPLTFSPTSPTIRLPPVHSQTPRAVKPSLPSVNNTTGIKRKPTSLAVESPFPKGGHSKGGQTLTPLSVTKAAGEGSFDRLGPISAPRFQTPARPSGDEELFLRGGQGSMGRLKIGGDEGAVSDEEEFTPGGLQLHGREEAVDVSPGGHVTKRLARNRPVSRELRAQNTVQVRSFFCISSASTISSRPCTMSLPVLFRPHSERMIGFCRSTRGLMPCTMQQGPYRH